MKGAANWYHVRSTNEYVGVMQETSTKNDVYEDLILKNSIDTVDKVWNNAVLRYESKLCLGTRRVLGVEDEKQSSGKVFQKLNLGNYEWMSYKEAHDISTKFGSGLRVLGQEPKKPIAIYAETRAEWIIASLGAFSQNIIVSTLYTNLGNFLPKHHIKGCNPRYIISIDENFVTPLFLEISFSNNN